jgi:hypothetical protein
MDRWMPRPPSGCCCHRGYAAVDGILRDPAMIAYDTGLLDAQWSDWRANRAVSLFAAAPPRRRARLTLRGWSTLPVHPGP